MCYAFLLGDSLCSKPAIAPEEHTKLIGKAIAKVFGTKNEREVKRLMPRVTEINALEAGMQKLSDAELRAKTDEFRTRVKKKLTEAAGDYEDPVRIEELQQAALKEVLEELLPVAFAVVREAGRRVL